MTAVVLAVTFGVLRIARNTTRRMHVTAPAPAPVGDRAEAVEMPADSRLVGAQEALARKDFPAALRQCNVAQKRGAPLPDVLMAQAEIFKETGYLDQEIETLRRWSTVAPRDHRPRLKLFYIYLDLGWRREAGQMSEQVFRLAPHEARSQAARAIFYYRSNEPARGLKFIEEARRLDPRNADLGNLHATILLKAQRFQEAEAEIRKLLARDPRRTSDRQLLIEALLAQHKTEELRALLQEMQRQEPGNIEVAYEIGVLEEKQGHHVEAARQLEKVAAQNAQYSKTLWHLGRIYMEQGRVADGRRLLKTFQTMDSNTGAYLTALLRLEARPNDPTLHYRLAQFHLAEDELPQAIVELRRVVELRPGDVQARKDLVDALTRHGRITEARRLTSAPSIR